MVTVHADAASEPCMVLVEAVKDASPALKVLPPLLLYEAEIGEKGTRTLTPQAASIYDRCAFPIDTNKKEIKKENHHEKS